jgi:putative flippase GtrA
LTCGLSHERLAEVWRYYQAGLLNAAFGFALYSGFVALGMNMYVAQIIGHVIGVGFNYLTYSRHTFRGSAPAKLRFTLSYVINYFVSLATLLLAGLVIKSPYAAGGMSIVLTSVINYFALKRFVFARTVVP